MKKLEKCIKRYINDYLEKDWYDEEEFGDKINEIIDWINKFESIPQYIKKHEEIHIQGKEFSILENLSINDIGFNNGYSDLSIKQKIAKDFISKEELKEFMNSERIFIDNIDGMDIYKLITRKFNL